GDPRTVPALADRTVLAGTPHRFEGHAADRGPARVRRGGDARHRTRMSRRRLAAAGLSVLALAGCTRGVVEGGDPTASAGIPPAITVATADFPSFWLAEQIGGDAAEVETVDPAEVADTDADLFAYVPGIDPEVDAAA